MKRSLSRILVVVFLLAYSLVEAQSPAGKAMQLNGSSYVNLGSSNFSTFSSSFPFTIMAWVKASGASGVQNIFSSHNYTGGYSGVFLQLTNDRFALHFGNGQSFTPAGSQGFRTNSITGQYGRWVHVAVVVQSVSNVQFYLNGKLAPVSAVGTATSTHAGIGAAAYIGNQYVVNTNRHFNGELDEVSFWSVALSATQIRNYMCTAQDGSEPNLYALYQFDGTGTTVQDLSPNARNGTISGSQTRVTSSAPLGDSSLFISSSTNTSTVTWPSGVVSANVSGAGSPHTLHLYKVNRAVNIDPSITLCDTAEPYYGVFLGDLPQQRASITINSSNSSDVYNRFSYPQNFQDNNRTSPTVFSNVYRQEVLLNSGGTPFVYNQPDVTSCSYPYTIFYAGPSTDDLQWPDGSNASSWTVNQPGSYILEITRNCYTYIDTFLVRTDTAFNSVALTDSLIICNAGQQNVALYNGSSNPPVSSVLWADGEVGTQRVFNTNGWYLVWIELDSGCWEYDSIYVQIQDALDPLPGDTTLCSPLNFTLSIPAASSSVVWSTGATSSSLVVTQAGRYWVTFELNGCQVDDTINISTFANDSIIPPYSVELCTGGMETIEISDYFVIQQALQVTWNTGHSGSSITVDGAGTYVATVTNICGSYQLSFEVQEVNCDVYLYIPSAFSPNGDGLNDTWRYYLSGLDHVKIQVFDRWGNCVFLSSSVDGPFWDGTYAGAPVQLGAYSYLIEGTDRIGQFHSRRGIVTVIY